MKKIYWLLGLLLATCYSCSELDDFPTDPTSKSSLSSITRTAGDGVYDALGYGYDITEEYLGENATKFKVLDIEAFVKSNPDRFDNPFVGIIDQKVTAGDNAETFLQQLITDTNFSGSVASLGEAGAEKKKGFFSATIKSGFKSDTKYLYSSVFSFARAEVLKKQRRYLLNTDVNTLSGYLSSAFTEDLNKYSAEKIIEMYGTHVLTNITVGGTYTAYYRSTIIKEVNRTEKTKTVSAGAKFNLNKIGLDANGSWSKTEITESNKSNSNWECYVKCLGGATSGTSYTITPNQGTSITINLGDWSKSVDDKNSRIVEINWNATYPIYELISDPVKKQQIKDATLRYIDSKKINILSLSPMFEMFAPSTNDRYYVFSWDMVLREVGVWEAEYRGHRGYILNESGEDTQPMYEMYHLPTGDRYYVFSWDMVEREVNVWGAEYRGHRGYVFNKFKEDTQPMYEMYAPSAKDRYYVFSWDMVEREVNVWGAEYRDLNGYIYRL